MLILQEMKSKGIENISDYPKVYCKVFKDNAVALELAHTPKIWLQTKHINVLYHHFGSYVRDNSVCIFPIDTFNQILGILTNALPRNYFLCHWKKPLKW